MSRKVVGVIKAIASSQLKGTCSCTTSELNANSEHIRWDTSRNAKTGQHYVALFNLSDKPEQREVSVKLSDLGMKKLSEVTDLWTGKKVVNDGRQITVELKPHSCILYAVK